MARTVVTGKQVKDSSIQRDDLDVTTSGQAVITRIIPGVGLKMTSTGVDSGTGDVTLDLEYTSGLVKQFIYTQYPASTLWIVDHFLNAFPEVIIFDEAGERVYSDIEYIDENRIIITFPIPYAGKAVFTINQLTQFYYYKPIPDSSWTIVHNLHRYPDVIIFDSSGSKIRVYADIRYDSEDQVTLIFTGALAGEAYFI